VQTAKILVVNFQELQQEYGHRIDRGSFWAINNNMIRLCITIIVIFNVDKSSIFGQAYIQKRSAFGLTIPLQPFFLNHKIHCDVGVGPL
jgi:hypothetical protein